MRRQRSAVRAWQIGNGMGLSVAMVDIVPRWIQVMLRLENASIIAGCLAAAPRLPLQ